MQQYTSNISKMEIEKTKNNKIAKNNKKKQTNIHLHVKINQPQHKK